jgi:hypothetical protein
MIQPNAAKQPAGHLGRARVARTVALLLSGIAKVRHDPCYPRSAGGPDGIGQ